MGIGAMCTVMLKLPMTATLLATLLLFSDGTEVIPVVIVAVVVAYAVTAWLPQTPDEFRTALRTSTHRGRPAPTPPGAPTPAAPTATAPAAAPTTPAGA
jgi:hypothetical protein